MVIFFDSALLLTFLILVVGLGVKVVSTLNGIIAVLAIIVFILETILLVGANLSAFFRRENRTIGGIFKLILALGSSALCIFISYLFMSDLQLYTDDLWSLLEFVFALFFGGLICLCQFVGASAMISWAYGDCSGTDGEFLKSVLMQLGSAAFLYWICGT